MNLIKQPVQFGVLGLQLCSGQPSILSLYSTLPHIGFGVPLHSCVKPMQNVVWFLLPSRVTQYARILLEGDNTQNKLVVDAI